MSSFVGPLLDELVGAGHIIIFIAPSLRRFVAFSVPLQSTFPGQFGQERGRGQILRAYFVRVFVAQLVQAERAALRDLDGARDKLGVCRVAAGDLVPRTQMALGVGQQTCAGLGERASLADARQHVLQITPLGNVVMHVVGGDERDAGLPGQFGELRETYVVGHVIGQLGGEVECVGEDFSVSVQGIEGSRDQGIKGATKRRSDGATEGLRIGDLRFEI